MKFQFYDVDVEYLNYLRQFEPRLPQVLYEHHNKFVCGVVFEKNGLPYVVPVSSNTRPQKTSIIIKNRRNQPISSLRFSFMFPCPAEFLKYKNFKQEASDSYRRWLQEEIRYCNSRREKLHNKAEYTYFHRCIEPKEPFVTVCCDFDLLEDKCREYCAARHIDIVKPESEKQDLHSLLSIAKHKELDQTI